MLVRSARREYKQLSPEGKRDLINGANHLRTIITECIKEKLVGETSYDRFKDFIEKASLSVASSRDKAQEGSIHSTIITSVRTNLVQHLLKIMPGYAGVKVAPLAHRCAPFPLSNSILRNCGILRKYLVGNLPIEDIGSLFSIGTLNTDINSIHFNGGNFITAICLKHKETSISRFLKCEKGVVMNKVFESKDERKQASMLAQNKNKKEGKATRVALPAQKGIVAEKVFFEKEIRVDEEKIEEEKEIHSDDKPQFVLKLHMTPDRRENIERLLHWLKSHHIVALDPGIRWVVSGVICRLTEYTIDGEYVSLRFIFRRLRVSGHKFGYSHAYHDTREQNMILNRLTESSFNIASADIQHQQVNNILTEEGQAGLEAYGQHLLDHEVIEQNELRRLHQIRMSLRFVRHISSLCAGYGDPIILIWDQGGGGHGRQQVIISNIDHILILTNIQTGESQSVT